MSAKTWIDLTDIELWAGHHGGTQRVVYGIAKNYYLSEDDSVGFFAYSNDKDIFYETSFEPIYERVESLKNQKVLDTAVEVSLKQRIKAKVLPYVPEFVRKNRVLKQRLKKTLHFGLNSYRQLHNIQLRLKAPKSENRHLAAITFKDVDTVLMLGKPWDNPKIQDLLERQKRSSSFKLVQVIYDLIISLYPHLHHPSLFDSYTKHMFKVAQSSDLVLPISKSSERDFKLFCERLHLPIPLSKVIRLGDEIEDTEALKPSVQGLSDSFVLCVGTIENRKNHALLYSVYKLAAERGITLPQLVIVGGNGWLSDDVRYLITNDTSMKDKILILNNISDGSLAWMYQNALFSVYPSLYEGWGLPVAESLAYGTPVAASSSSSIPEIGGELVQYFSPNSTDECLKVMEVMSAKAYAQTMRKTIAKKYVSTSWHDSYEQTEAAIKE